MFSALVQIRWEGQMSYFYTMLAVLVAGVVVLTAGVMLNREKGQSLESAGKDGFAWGMSFFISFAAEFMSISYLAHL
jgi:hypothetical protein